MVVATFNKKGAEQIVVVVGEDVNSRDGEPAGTEISGSSLE